MKTYPRLYEPSVYRFAWPVAMLMLLGWAGLLALGKPAPIWLEGLAAANLYLCLLYTSPSPRDRTSSRMPSSALKQPTTNTLHTAQLLLELGLYQ